MKDKRILNFKTELTLCPGSSSFPIRRGQEREQNTNDLSADVFKGKLKMGS